MSVAAATRSEISKQFTTNGWWIILVILVAYIGLMSFGMGAALALAPTGTGAAEAGGMPPMPAEALAPWLYGLAATVGYALPFLYGTLIVTSEFRHNLLVPTFLATPRRGQVVSAKLFTGIVMGALFAVAGLVASVGGGVGALALAGLDNQLSSPDTLMLLGRTGLAIVLWTLVGIGLGTVIRNQVASIVVVLAFTQFVEPILRVAGMRVDWLFEPLKYLPGAASDALVGSSLLSMAGPGTVELLSWWQGGLVLAGYAVLFAVIGSLTTWRRDVS